MSDTPAFRQWFLSFFPGFGETEFGTLVEPLREHVTENSLLAQQVAFLDAQGANYWFEWESSRYGQRGYDYFLVIPDEDEQTLYMLQFGCTGMLGDG